MSKELYGVTLQKCAWVYVEAESAEEAMKIAEAHADDLDCYCGYDGLNFEDSEIEVDSAETYGTEPEELKDDQVVIVAGKVGRLSNFFTEEGGNHE